MSGSSLALVAMCLVAFFSYLTVGMIAPFLPQHLSAMGVSERWSGIIFAFYPIAVITTTPLCNTLVAHYGRLPLIGVGLLTQAASAFTFGWFGDNLTVLLLSRFAQGCGASASNLATFALVADLFEDSLGRVMGLNELFIGAGFSVGPLVGALLYAQGGFPLPFVVCSAFLAAIAALTPVLRGVNGGSATSSLKAADVSAGPNGGDNGSGEAPGGGGGSALRRLAAACTLRLLAPAGLLLLGTVVWGVIDSGFYTVHAAHDLRLGQTAIGANLAAASAAYSGLGLLAGSAADRFGYGVTMLCGAFASATSLVLLGPAAQPAVEVISGLCNVHVLAQVQRWWDFAILILLGCGQAFMLIPSLGAMKATVASGDATATEACVSLFNAFQQAGLVLGPLASAALGAQYSLGNAGIAAAIFAYGALAGSQLRGRPGAGNTQLADPLLGPLQTPQVNSPKPALGSPLLPDRQAAVDNVRSPSKLVI